MQWTKGGAQSHQDSQGDPYFHPDLDRRASEDVAAGEQSAEPAQPARRRLEFKQRSGSSAAEQHALG